MSEKKLSDSQLMVLELLVQARKKGVMRLHRHDFLSNQKINDEYKLKLTFAALTMPSELLTWHGHNEFSITDAAFEVYEKGRMKRPIRVDEPPHPSKAVVDVICLPDLSNQKVARQ